MVHKIRYGNWRSWKNKYCTRSRIKYYFLVILILYLCEFAGIFIILREKNFYTNFNYPYDGDALQLAQQIRNGETPNVDPINEYNFNFLKSPRHKCYGTDGDAIQPHLLILVKTATDNFDQRVKIRKSWGAENNFPNFIIRTVFAMGLPTSKIPNEEQHIQKLIDDEYSMYGDIVQSDFKDVYFNNTIKTMRSIQWVVENCGHSKYFIFVDDDYYVSVKNVLRFLKDPIHYPNNLDDSIETQTIGELRWDENSVKVVSDKLPITENQIEDDTQKSIFPKINEHEHLKRRKRFEYSEDRLLAGYVMYKRSPLRDRLSKWRVNLEEYQWHKYPTYVTGGCIIYSRAAILDMYYVSKFTKHFRFDDIYLGIVALKAKINPTHNNEFYFNKAKYKDPYSYKNVIATHGYSSAPEMLDVWMKCREKGFA